MTDAEADALWWYARGCGLPMVEIGTWLGYSGSLLALASGGRVRVCSVDPFRPWRSPATGEMTCGNRPAAIRNIQRVGVRVIDAGPPYGVHEMQEGPTLELAHATSAHAATQWQGGEIGLLFVDGDHDAVAMDWSAWEAHLPRGSIVAFHDYTPGFPAVVRDVDALLRCGFVDDVAQVGTLRIVRRN